MTTEDEFLGNAAPFKGQPHPGVRFAAGPELPSLAADQRNLHRALHRLVIALAETLGIDKFAAALDRWLTRKDHP